MSEWAMAHGSCDSVYIHLNANKFVYVWSPRVQCLSISTSDVNQCTRMERNVLLRVVDCLFENGRVRRYAGVIGNNAMHDGVFVLVQKKNVSRRRGSTANDEF